MDNNYSKMLVMSTFVTHEKLQKIRHIQQNIDLQIAKLGEVRNFVNIE